ncbi:MAG: TetR/AcrR family transcriptional regulator [Planctomycetes bacterium]|nr:TetR/AcrR family transcriptional regulator [Planctomycetota bacterium]NBY01233.1 TetR/AcrR family transcriptional regulator [Planctomycetota bacterium]
MSTKLSNPQDKILASAEIMFASKRFHEVRMEDIAISAGVGKGTIYRYFKDKEELYAALLKDASKELMNLIEKAVKFEVSCKNKLIVILQTSINLFDAKPHLFDLILHAEAFQNTLVEFPWQQTRWNVIQLVESVFQQAEEQKEFSIQNPKESALLLLGGLRAIIRFGHKPRQKELCNEIVHHFLNGFSKSLPSAN